MWTQSNFNNKNNLTDVVFESLLLICMNFNAFLIISISNFELLLFLLAHLRMLLFHSKITSKDLIKMKNISVAFRMFFSRNSVSCFLQAANERCYNKPKPVKYILEMLLFTASLSTETVLCFLIPELSKNILICKSSRYIRCSKIVP